MRQIVHSTLIVLCLLSSSILGAQGYKPTPKELSDPGLVLDQAWEFTKEGRYEAALERHVWYHENALDLDPSELGVHATFALHFWNELGKRYAPALEELQRQRLLAMERALDGKGTSRDVRVAAAISLELEDLELMDEFCRELWAEGSDLGSTCVGELRQVRYRLTRSSQTTD